jgi:plasmid stabilization system protein ParE
MSFKVKFTDTAKEDLRDIATYIAEQSKDKKIAINFVNELREKTKILESFPESGAFPDDRIMKNSDYRFLVHKEYLIFYHYVPKDCTSYILSIFNAKRDYSRVMRRFIKK